MIYLDECLELRRNINEIDEKVKMIQEVICSPRNQVLSGMPRGGGNNAIEQYIINVEKYINQKKKFENKLKTLWKYVLVDFTKCNFTREEKHLMFLKFYMGYTWNICCNIMQKHYPDDNWNENKCFRTYRILMSKMNKK